MWRHQAVQIRIFYFFCYFRYCVLGLHESYNCEDILVNLDSHKFPYFTYESSIVRGETTFEDQVDMVIKYLSGDGDDYDFGCEVDVDSIIGMPSSAKTPVGITAENAAYFVSKVTAALDPRYLHLSEGAPRWADGKQVGEREVGKSVALFVATFIKAKLAHK